MLHIFLTLCKRTKLPLYSMLIRNNPLATLILQKTRTFFGGGAKMPSQAVIKLISDINFLGRKNIGKVSEKMAK